MLHRREDRGGFRFVVPGEIDDTSDAGANGRLCELRDHGILQVICPTCQMVFVKSAKRQAGSHRLLCMGLFSQLLAGETHSSGEERDLLGLRHAANRRQGIVGGGAGPLQHAAGENGRTERRLRQRRGHGQRRGPRSGLQRGLQR
jgi:hypothetical protein